MTYYGAPPPPPPAGPWQPYPGPPPQPPPPPSGSSERFGDRRVRRPEPRYTVAIAGVGAALALLGVLEWGEDYYADRLSLSTNRNLLGGALATVLVALGFLLVLRARRGPLATAGVVLSGIGVPLALAFFTLDATARPQPINLDAVFWVSLIVWVVSYGFVPGARGHTFYLFLVATGFYEYVLIKNITGSTFRVSGSGLGGFFPTFTGLGTVAAISLVFGLAYFVIAFLLDRVGSHGPATGLIFPAFIATTIGVLAWTPDIHRGWAGVVAIVIGLPVAWYGGRYGRRFSCFTAAAGVTFGVLLVMSKAASDGTAAGIGLVVIGVLAVAAAATLARAVGEPDDMDPRAVVRSR